MKNKAQNILSQVQLDYLYCLKCAINGKCDDVDRLSKADWDRIIKMAFAQSQVELIFSMCQNTNIQLPGSCRYSAQAAYEHGIHREVLMDYEREEIYKFLDLKGIWHCSLKGINIKSLYPGVGLRYSADNDILVDPKYSFQIMEYMKSRGYEVLEYDEKEYNDSYLKNPSYHWEIHRGLLKLTDKSPAGLYFNNLFPNLVREGEEKYLYHMTAEDEYIYLLLHMKKHYKASGTGLRSLVDIYLYWKAYKDKIDEKSLNSRLTEYGLKELEQVTKNAAYRLFEGDINQATREEIDMFAFMFVVGSHGNMDGEYLNYHAKYRGKEKTGFFKALSFSFHKVFLDKESIKLGWPFIYKTKVLIPFLMLYRIIKSIFNGRFMQIIKAMMNNKK